MSKPLYKSQHRVINVNYRLWVMCQCTSNCTNVPPFWWGMLIVEKATHVCGQVEYGNSVLSQILYEPKRAQNNEKKLVAKKKRMTLGS